MCFFLHILSKIADFLIHTAGCVYLRLHTVADCIPEHPHLFAVEDVRYACSKEKMITPSSAKIAPGAFQLASLPHVIALRTAIAADAQVSLIGYFCSPAGFENFTALGASSLQVLIANCLFLSST